MSIFRYQSVHIQFLRDNYVSTSRKDITVMFNAQFGASVSEASIAHILSRQGIKSGRDSKFAPGHNVWNKGKQGVTLGNAGSFKQGHNYNTRAADIGTTHVKDGTIRVKIAQPSKWVRLHVKLWEAENGPLPASHSILFKDRDKLNCVLENLFLVTPSMMQYLTSMDFQNCAQEDADSIRLIAAIQSKVKAAIKAKLLVKKDLV